MSAVGRQGAEGWPAASLPLGCFLSGGLNLSLLHPPSVHSPSFCGRFWQKQVSNTQSLTRPANISQLCPKAKRSILGNPSPCFVTFPTAQPRLTRHSFVHLPLTGPLSVFWGHRHRVHLSQGLELQAKLHLGL